MKKCLTLKNGLKKMVIKFGGTGDLDFLPGRGWKSAVNKTDEEVATAVVETAFSFN